ncbi:hypothetical protein SEA_DARTHPHADER_67 [Mycobacterium phage DarthPhader]|uniref:Uncharacterized protein n=1 Tax=Mycobacterium phage DarthPhader TaxID=1912975 RepID=A0A1I9S413_9CAUD|nr:hypothetical protein KIV60_gp34 [Mycobacterium phage DarthPhader]AOZ61307.1 hypothetical protein SEA_DARTHPHADER_67 [Mycobacterium phage DarthPhader]
MTASLAERPIKERRSALADFAEKLVRNRGYWFSWPKPIPRAHQQYCTVSNVKTGKLKDFPVGDFEAKREGNTVYVRYVGEAV